MSYNKNYLFKKQTAEFCTKEKFYNPNNFVQEKKSQSTLSLVNKNFV